LIGDFLAFLAASSVVERYVEVKDSLGNSKEFKNITEVKKSYDSYISNPSEFTIESCQRNKKNYLNSAKAIIKNKIRLFASATNCKEVLIVMGGPTNFRNDLPLFSKYKDRVDSFRPSCLKEIRDMLEEMYPTEYSEHCEADDLISMYQYLGYKTKQHIVVVAVDKDAKQTPGLLYNPMSNVLQDCSGFGKIFLKEKSNGTKKLEGYGRLWFYSQVCCGDPVDTYNPFVGKANNITDLKFYNMFKDFTTDEECWKQVAALYKNAYGNLDSWVTWNGTIQKGTWIDILQAYVDVVHMWRWKKDRIDVPKVLQKYNII